MEKFNEYKKRFFLSTLKVSMTSIADSKDAALKRKTSVVNFSDVSTTLEGVSDEHIYMMIRAMQRDMPGISGVLKLSLTKAAAITEADLRNISQNGPVALVKGEMKFTWYGINPVEDKGTKGPGGPGGPGQPPARMPSPGGPPGGGP